LQERLFLCLVAFGYVGVQHDYPKRPCTGVAGGMKQKPLLL
jgi:hypothetical protein